MPLASASDLILAGVNDIVQALNDPTPGAVLAALNDGHVTALRQLTELLTGILPSGNNASATPTPAPPLRVDTPNQATIKPNASPTSDAPILRVDPTLKSLVPSPNDDLDTYHNSTGPQGKARRRRRK